MVMMVSLPCCNTIIVIIFCCLGSFKCLLHLQGPTEEGEFTLRNNICVFFFKSLNAFTGVEAFWVHLIQTDCLTETEYC